MKFEITSFVAAFVVYLVRLRVQYASETRPLYSGSFLENRSHLYISDLASLPAAPDQEPNGSAAADSSAMERGSGCSSGMRNATSFVSGCSRAV